MRKTNRGDDADSGGGNSNHNGDVDGDGVFDTKGRDEADCGGDFTECNGSSKMETRVGVMR